MKNCQERITINPDICHGKPYIKGTRIWFPLEEEAYQVSLEWRNLKN